MIKTIPFYQMIDENSEVWSIIDRSTFPHLFPQNVENLTDEMKDNIREYFYYRQIGFSSPTRFLRAFYRMIKERAYIWKTLIDTEKALRADDMIYNYDLRENETNSHESSSTLESSGTTSSTRTPNLTTTTQDTDTTTTRQMDTPDGITSDIDNYLSAAEKVSGSSGGTTTQTGTETSSGTSGSTTENSINDSGTRSLTRKGNIGVMTSAQILGGFREAQVWDAYDAVIFPELNTLFLSTYDVEDNDIELW